MIERTVVFNSHGSRLKGRAIMPEITAKLHIVKIKTPAGTSHAARFIFPIAVRLCKVVAKNSLVLSSD